MRLRGTLDLSLGNFLCLRGFASMGDLYDISEPAPSQRNLIDVHRDEMVAFLNQGEFLFFPEVILCTTLNHGEDINPAVDELFRKALVGERFAYLKFSDFGMSCSVSKTQKKEDKRSFDILRTATLDLYKQQKHKFWRIDGNHRLSATPEDPKFRKHNTPYCLLFFRDNISANRFGRALFHNINYKQVPLTMEQSLKLIVDEKNKDLFDDEELKTNQSFGWPYYLARQLHNKIDMDMIPNLKPLLSDEPRTFLVKQLCFLRDRKVLHDNEHAIHRFKAALGSVNTLFGTYPALKDTVNRGLLAALVYYDLAKEVPIASFIRWVLDNHLHLIEGSSSADLIAIFDKILASRKRTIFVSMPFEKPKPDDHYAIIQRVAKEVSDAHSLKPPLKVERVDWFHDGTSYEITDKIIEMMSDCGLLIGNLTHCNPNVYHEVGFIMGKAKAEGKDVANMLLFLDESVADPKDKSKRVGFNLTGIKQLRFTKSEVEFAPALKENLEKFFKLKP